jgi:ribosomal-protein-alanine N-acetyltransferase
MIETIREAKKDDIKAVQKIQQESFGYSYSDGKLVDMLSELFFVADVDSKVAAYAISNRDGLVVHMATALDFRRKGIGRRLMMHVERELKKINIKKARLHLRENSTYRPFHEEQGYEVKKIIPKYYSNGDSAVFMEKELI